jgi:hypothetical protein
MYAMMCRPQKREVTYFLGLLLLAVAFGVKRWRYLRSRRAEEEYEKRRWGQAKPVNNVCPCCNSFDHALHIDSFTPCITYQFHLHSDASAFHFFAEQALICANAGWIPAQSPGLKGIPARTGAHSPGNACPQGCGIYEYQQHNQVKRLR